MAEGQNPAPGSRLPAEEAAGPEPETTNNQVPKRQAIVANMVGQAAVINAALVELGTLQLQYLQAGTLLDGDLAGVNAIQQCTAFMVGLFISTVVPALQTWYTTALPSSGPVPRDIFLQMLS